MNQKIIDSILETLAAGDRVELIPGPNGSFRVLKVRRKEICQSPATCKVNGEEKRIFIGQKQPLVSLEGLK